MQCCKPFTYPVELSRIAEGLIERFNATDSLQATEPERQPRTRTDSLRCRPHGQCMATACNRLLAAGTNLGNQLPHPLLLIKAGAIKDVVQEASQRLAVSSQRLAIKDDITLKILNIVDFSLGGEGRTDATGFRRNTILHLQVIQIAATHFRNQSGVVRQQQQFFLGQVRYRQDHLLVHQTIGATGINGRRHVSGKPCLGFRKLQGNIGQVNLRQDGIVVLPCLSLFQGLGALDNLANLFVS